MIDWLTSTAVAVTALIALVLLVRQPVARVFGPRLAYSLWTIPAARAVLPQITLTPDAPAPVIGGLATLMLGNTAPAAPTSLIDPAAVPVVLVALWAGGAVIFAARSLASYARLRRAIDADALVIDRHGRVAVVCSSAVDGPIALGVWRPQIVLPRDFTARFTADQQRYVIAHELAHHNAHDLVANIAAFALLCLNWFNPLAWLGWRAFRIDQEAACDARVLRQIGGEHAASRADYGRAIVHAATSPTVRPAHALALPMASRSALIHRLRSLNMPILSPRRMRTGRIILATAALVLLPLTASVSYAVDQQDAPPESPDASVPAPTAGTDRDVRTVVIRRTGAAETTSDTPRVTVRRIDRTAGSAQSPDARRGAQVVVVPTGGASAASMVNANCRDGEARQLVDRAVAGPGSTTTLRVVNCGDSTPAQNLAAIRMARTTIAAMGADQLPAEARTSALAELDTQIAAMERSAAPD